MAYENWATPLKTPYKIFLDGELVHYEEHLGRS